MANFALQQSIKGYEDALKELSEALLKKDNTRLNLLEEKLLRVLVTRDIVQAHLINETSLRVHDLKKLCELDDWSESIQKSIAEVGKLEKWRRALKPSPEAWWWFPKPPIHPLDRFDWAWSSLSFFFLIISFGLFTNIAPRFFAGGSDPVGITLIAAQSIFGFLSAKGSIPLAWQEQIQKVIGTTRLPKHWQQKIRCVLAFLFLALSISFYQALPLVSNFYYWWGVQEEKVPGHLGSAQSKYDRAILLNPSNASAHYNLGSLYEKMQMADRARSEYKIATLQNGNVNAYSNLTRLEILDKKYSTAVALANKALINLEGIKNLEQDKDEKKRKINTKYELDAEYALRKNLGWARLAQKRYKEAQEQLRKAISLKQKKAAAHCLIAQTFEAENIKKESLIHWKECARFAKKEIKEESKDRFPIDEDNWLGQSNNCLKPVYRNKKCLESLEEK